jgi:hypothetical protein
LAAIGGGRKERKARTSEQEEEVELPRILKFTTHQKPSQSDAGNHVDILEKGLDENEKQKSLESYRTAL